MEKRILTILTRTPLHIGAGSSVGAIDQPIVRERHTRFPVIPGTSLKGVLADLWPANDQGKRDGDAIWLFGAEDASAASAGALLIGEGKLLAFPVRSAKGAFAWITCPLALARFSRDTGRHLPNSTELTGETCHAPAALCLADKKVILEEYVIDAKEGEPPAAIVDAMKDLTGDDVWKALAQKLVILSDELFAYFAENACETAQHIRIDDETGTVAPRALFNQENVPSETLFYAVLNAQNEKRKNDTATKKRTAAAALAALDEKLKSDQVGSTLQLGADETTGLGWCSVSLQSTDGKTE